MSTVLCCSPTRHDPAGVSRGIITLRGLRLLRVMSFLRLERSYQAMKNLREIFALKKQELGVVTYLTAVLVLTSSTTMYVDSSVHWNCFR